MKVFPANSGIKLLQVLPAEADRPTALITVIQELKSKDQNTVHKKLYEITVPAERAPLKVPVSTDYAEGQIEIVLEYPASASPPPLKAITPALTTIDPDICVICLAEGIQCCPLQ
ncbi:MAG: hypothetical protein E6J91_40535 [Deltaproteobacteria bacterium]|nr:MAG: hypothetical protein E6J91_40535 [Deltaproteobacteria bacterium]